MLTSLDLRGIIILWLNGIVSRVGTNLGEMLIVSLNYEFMDKLMSLSLNFLNFKMEIIITTS